MYVFFFTFILFGVIVKVISGSQALSDTLTVQETLLPPIWTFPKAISLDMGLKQDKHMQKRQIK